MKVLHIVGTFGKRWAISNRAYNLVPHLKKFCEADVYGKNELPATPPACDLLHLHTPILIHMVLNGPYAALPWGFEMISELDRTGEWLERGRDALQTARFCIAKNPRLAEAVRPYLGPNCIVRYIPNGVDRSLFFPRPYRIGWCGNKRADSLEYKGVAIIRKAVDALASVWSDVLKLEFVLDPGNCPDTVLSHAEIAAWYRTLDLYVSASKGEGCSNTILEALASGLPVVSTDVGIAQELTKDARLFIVERSKTGIATGIRRHVAPVIGRLRAMRAFAWEKVAEQYAALYAEVLK